MKILITNGEGLVKGFARMFADKYRVTVQKKSDTDLGKFEDVNALFKGMEFDAVIHFALKTEEKSEMVLDSDSLVYFKNVQYASILNGVKKLLIVGSADDLMTSDSLIEAKEPDDNSQATPSGGYKLSCHLIRQLASKDKISTFLRVFELFGNGIKDKANTLSAIINAATAGKRNYKIEADKTVSAIFAEDFFEILSLFLDGDYPKGSYNIVSDDKLTYIDTAKRAAAAARRNGKEFTYAIKNSESGGEFSGSNEKLKSIMPFVKFTAFNTAVNKMFANEPPKSKRSTSKSKKGSAKKKTATKKTRK